MKGKEIWWEDAPRAAYSLLLAGLKRSFRIGPRAEEEEGCSQSTE